MMEKIILYRQVDDTYKALGTTQVSSTVAQHLAPDGYGEFLAENWPTAFSYRDDGEIYTITELTLLEWLKSPSSAKAAFKNCVVLAAISDDVDLAEFLKHFTPTRILNAVRILIQIAFAQSSQDNRIELARLTTVILNQFVTNLMCGDYAKDRNFKSGNRCVSMLLRLKFLVSEDMTQVKTLKMFASDCEIINRVDSLFYKMSNITKTIDELVEKLKTCEIKPARF